MENNKKHWDGIYSKSVITKLGWFEEIPSASLRLIEKCGKNKTVHILDVGTGVTTLIPNLITAGYKNISALDISSEAIELAKNEINSNYNVKINWIVDDITNPKTLENLEGIDIWHDRTVLHFLTREKDQKAYLKTLKNIVNEDGFVIIAVFSLSGAKKCSGLDIKNYNHEMIAEFLGSEFRLIEYFPHMYIQPSGNERPYIYTLFQRKNITA